MLLKNSGICPHCKQELVSRTRHDMQMCRCGKSFVDGGLDYIRRSADLISTTVDTADLFHILREKFEWGTYGKTGKDKLKYVALKDLSLNHIDNILNNLELPEDLIEIFIKETKYRRFL